MTIEDVVILCKKRSMRWTSHILERILYRGISIEDIENAVINGEIIEQYPNDYPYPSCLLMGYTKTGKVLHVVCGSDGIELWLITAYYPNSAQWTDDFRQRSKI
ncbi:MAG: DUF4258 domain-containing protein [Treponema sp.]|nr:DUF4258 domain-containing protein [Treponema sp.]